MMTETMIVFHYLLLLSLSSLLLSLSNQLYQINYLSSAMWSGCLISRAKGSTNQPVIIIDNYYYYYYYYHYYHLYHYLQYQLDTIEKSQDKIDAMTKYNFLSLRLWNEPTKF